MRSETLNNISSLLSTTLFFLFWAGIILPGSSFVLSLNPETNSYLPFGLTTLLFLVDLVVMFFLRLVVIMIEDVARTAQEQESEAKDAASRCLIYLKLRGQEHGR